MIIPSDQTEFKLINSLGRNLCYEMKEGAGERREVGKTVEERRGILSTSLEYFCPRRISGAM